MTSVAPFEDKKEQNVKHHCPIVPEVGRCVGNEAPKDELKTSNTTDLRSDDIHEVRKENESNE